MPNLTLIPNYPDVPTPAGAVRVDDWQDDDGGVVTRYFLGSSWIIEATGEHGVTGVHISGFQLPDGRTVRWIAIPQQRAPHTMTVGQARELARALISASDEAERMQAADDDSGGAS